MQRADAQIWLSKTTSIFKKGVSPAEILLLTSEHSHNYGNIPADKLMVYAVAPTSQVPEPLIKTEFVGGNLVLDPTSKLTPFNDPTDGATEVSRLKLTYSKDEIDYLFPGNSPTLPQTFAEAFTTAAKMVSETNTRHTRKKK